MSFFSRSIATRLVLAVGAPTLCMVAIAGLYVSNLLSVADRMDRVAELTQFSRQLSAVVHELQRERGSSAGYIGSEGAREFTDRLQAQRSRTDLVIEQYHAALEQHDAARFSRDYQSQIEALSGELSGLAAHRQRVDALEVNLGEGVAPYTHAIRSVLAAFVSQVQLADDATLTQGMISLLYLMEAKENAGIERAIGANSLGSETVNASNHRRLFELQARQESYLNDFRQLMGDRWSSRLDGALQETTPRVDDFRRVLIEGGYGAALPANQAGTWFDASTRRIDALMDVETAFASDLTERAAGRYDEARQNAFLTIAVTTLLAVIAGVISILVSLGVVRPLRKIATTLDAVAHGQSDVEVAGVERADEIGVLARAAVAFVDTTARNQALDQERNQRERQAMEDRAAELDAMALKVEARTEDSLGKVSASADDIRARSDRVREVLQSATANAHQVAASASDSREKSGEAAEQADQLIAAINEVAQQISRGDELARDAVEKTAVSSQSVVDLREAAAQIGGFLEIINGLAEQTNLLALNATIESARAGEAGKGFAVVAAEVKALASQTNQSASEIGELVSSIQERTVDAVSSIEDITSAVSVLSDVTTAVAAAMEEQRASTASFRAFIEETRVSTDSVAAGAEGIAEAAASASEEAVSFVSTAEDLARTSEEARQDIPEIIRSASSQNTAAADEGDAHAA